MQNLGMAVAFSAPGPDRDAQIREYTETQAKLHEVAAKATSLGIYVQAAPLSEFLAQIAKQIGEAVERNRV
jgi:hypothetical protein